MAAFAKRVVVAVAALGVAAGAAPLGAQSTSAATVGVGRPDVRPERVAGEIVGGTYAGVIGYFLGRGIGTIATSGMSPESDRLRDGIVDGVGVVGGAFAIGSAVYAVGNIGAEAGSFPRTMEGVTIGLAASLVVSKLVFQGRVPADEGSAKRKWLAATIEASLPAIGATIAFNKSRRWQR
jgi:hypothetical protein